MYTNRSERVGGRDGYIKAHKSATVFTTLSGAGIQGLDMVQKNFLRKTVL